MKLIIILSLPLLLLSQMCMEDEGCKTVKKKLSFVPMIDSVGNPAPSSSETFDYKVIKIFRNCIALYNSQDNSAALDTSKSINPIDLARRVPFSQISLDCGVDGNKICLGYQFLEIYDRVSYKAEAIDAIAKLGGEFNKQCLILPIIDGRNKDLSSSLIYICEEDKNNLRTFFQFKDFLSRLIDNSHLLSLGDFNFAANSISLMEDLLKTVDSNKNMSSLFVKLDSQKIQGFIDPKNFNTKVLELPLVDINLSKGVHSVLNAIRLGLLSTNWSKGYVPKPIDGCCLMLPLKNRDNPLFFCIHYDDSNQFSSYECEKRVDIWLAKINNTAKRGLLGANGYFIKHHYKQKSYPELDCRNIKEIEIFKDRIHNIGAYQDAACESLQAFTTNFQYSDCTSDKDDDINQEIILFGRFDGRIETSLQQCLMKGFLDFGKVPMRIEINRSFLAINGENSLGGKRRFKGAK